MKIISWHSNKILYESEKETIRETIIEAISEGADLRGADLRDADLGDADLRDADLYHAYFFGRGGKTKIKKEQIESFFEALGIIVEE